MKEARVKLVGDPELLERVVEALREVYDPEIPVNIYDLGLIYEVHARRSEEGVPEIKIVMTMTAIGCPLAGSIVYFVEEAIKDKIPGALVNVELDFSKPWTLLRVSEEGRRTLKELFGYDVVEEWSRRAGGEASESRSSSP
ncbi:MAG: metal-sulfur cluster assembly factor [Acidilobaceae archaeon]